MNPAKPLLYLTFRSLVNGLKRALTTPRRLISLVFIIGYYFLIFGRPMRGNGAMPSGVGPTFDFPPLAVIEGLSFALFSVLSLFMLGGVMSANANFRPADVDVLFSTPLSPKVVLTFRILRDYLLTLFVPLIITIFGIRPISSGWAAIFRNMPNPEYSGLALRFVLISWILMSLSWVVISHAVTLWANRTDRNSDRRRRVFGISLGAFALLTVAYIGWRFSMVQSANDALTIAHTPGLRLVFFNATLATQMTMAPFTEYGPLNALYGLAGMFSLIGGAYWLALRQSPHLYDMSAIRVAATSKTMELQKSGDYTGMLALRAREGKFRGLRLSFISRRWMAGPRALIWKELLLQPRTMLGVVVMFGIIAIILSTIPAVVPDRRGNIGWLLLIMQGSTVFMITMAMAQTGFSEFLRRIDLQKPLPFPAWVTVTAEIVSKAILGIIVCAIGTCVAVAIRPSIWPFGLASLLLIPGVSVMLSACTFLVTMLFPDMEDASQRSLRGLMIMLSVAISGLLPILGFGVVVAFGAPAYVGGLVAGMLSLGVALVLNLLSGKLYETFNPSE